MFGENKNLKDIDQSSLTSISVDLKKDINGVLSYKKTSKLITALYMVTDVLEKDEPLRKKLRTLGADIISDMHMPEKGNGHAKSFIINKVDEVMSFMEIAVSINLISDMNWGILKKEFLELRQSLVDYIETFHSFGKNSLLSDFLREEISEKVPMFKVEHYEPIGHVSDNKNRTRIGVQKSGNLMKVLSDKASAISDAHQNDFVLLKKQRREDILSVIKMNGGTATITDIRSNAKGHLVSCGEKTLQRELVSMVKDNVLERTGEKRWSKYSISK